ncbi:uncharacterized protein H6S33_009854 [Morchella sextelata]|uniref:uncharacterized protein n=2 Tax=Morchella sextelata TaxID=1174677 RepID=UPI001D04964C|nr:uncharacterized protein H6S33_009854 [Morchella sextelata]KAH0602280.1 hypothetical protein H6S33_009854 [Morchella sextelata]
MLSRLSIVSNHLKHIHRGMSISADPFKRPIHTAACLIIGDEVLNGKTVDTNSPYFSRFCFDLGIELKRIEVISDDQDQIIEAARRMSANYDFVVTSGGIGPTHDDITYSSLAAAFGLPLRLHDETFRRMRLLSKHKVPFDWDTPSPTRTARLRMAELPAGDNVRVVYVSDDTWVPVAIINYNVHVLPGVPSIFVSQLEGMRKLFEEEKRVEGKKLVRVLISTALPESEVAEYLTELQEKVGARGVKVGSYPRWGKDHNTVTLVGKDEAYIESLVKEVEEGVKGTRITVEGEDEPEEPKEEIKDGNTEQAKAADAKDAESK